jgi:cytidyltransferase-like protein
LNQVVVAGALDDLRETLVRQLHEASKLGSVCVALWTDDAVQAATGQRPNFPFEEREYFISAIRYVETVKAVDAPVDAHSLPDGFANEGDTWVVLENEYCPEKRDFCRRNGLKPHVVTDDRLADIPDEPVDLSEPPEGVKKVLVTGCYDWFHSGHIRFFEEVSELGALYAVIGHDDNIKLLKGAGHPMFNERQRRYMVQAVRHVKAALVSSGEGWLDAEPEIRRIKPDIYAVNEDGHQPVKENYCKDHGIQYKVLVRTPKKGLPKRQSTELRGF